MDLFQVWGISKPAYNKAINRAFMDAAIFTGELDPDSGVPYLEDLEEPPLTPRPMEPTPEGKRQKAASEGLPPKRPRISAPHVVLNCMKRALGNVTTEVWGRCVDHVDRVLMEHYEQFKNTISKTHPTVEFEVGLTSDEDDDADWETCEELEDDVPAAHTAAPLKINARQFVPPPVLEVGEFIMMGDRDM